MSRPKNYLLMETERDPLKEIEVVYKKIHRKTQHLNFLNTCRENRIFPAFTYIKPKVVRRLNLKKPTIIKKRLEIFNGAILEHEAALITLRERKTEL